MELVPSPNSQYQVEMTPVEFAPENGTLRGTSPLCSVGVMTASSGSGSGTGGKVTDFESMVNGNDGECALSVPFE